MQFHVSDRPRFHPGPAVGGVEQRRLRGRAGHRQTVPAPVVVHGAARNDRVDPVTVDHRLGEGLQHDESAALSPHEAVGPLVEGIAAAVGRESPEGPHTSGAPTGEIEVHAPRDGQVALTGTQALAGHVDGHQGGRLSRVQDEARTTQPHGVGDAVGDHAPRRTGDRVPSVHPGAGGLTENRVVVPDRSHVETRRGQGTNVRSLVLQCLPDQLQGEPLVRVHLGGLPRGDPEEGCVERLDVVQEAAPCDEPGQPRAVGPTSLGNLSDRFDPGTDQGPEFIGSMRHGSPAGHADDGYREVSGLVASETRSAERELLHHLHLPASTERMAHRGSCPV